MTDDAVLLRQYVEKNSNDAFAQLVSRYLNLVYSAALRQVGGDAHAADDVAQLVFTDLAQKAPSLLRHPVITGWLYTATHHRAANWVRSRARRAHREQEAYDMHFSNTEDSSAVVWEQLRPALDAAMHDLRERDREIVLWRFFEKRALEEISSRLGLSENAARMRVERALEKLRVSLERRGITSTAAAIALAIPTQAVVAAPAGLAATIAGYATTTVASAGALTVLGEIISAAKLKVGIGATVLALGAVGVALQTKANTALREQIEVRAHRGLDSTTNRSPSGNKDLVTNSLDPVADDEPLGQLGPDRRSDLQKRRNEESDTPEGRRRNARLEREALDRSYAPFFRHLKLPPESLNHLKDLMVEKRLAVSEAHRMASAAGVPLGSEGERLDAAATQDIDEVLKRFLGVEQFEYYQNYERTLKVRPFVTEVQDYLSGTEQALTDEEADRIVAALQPLGFPADLAEEDARQIASALSPNHAQGFLAIYRSRVAAKRLLEKNRVAALEGKLHLTGESAKWYPQPHDAEAAGR